MDCRSGNRLVEDLIGMASGGSRVVRTGYPKTTQILIKTVYHVYGKTTSASHQSRKPPTRNESVPPERERIQCICCHVLRTIERTRATVEGLVIGICDAERTLLGPAG